MTGHPLCDQVVTLYHHNAAGTQRQVVRGCFYRWQQALEEGVLQTRFLLVLPAGIQVQIGDRVCDGVGPEEILWESFLPSRIPGVGQVAYVEPYYLDGRLHHTEAGRK